MRHRSSRQDRQYAAIPNAAMRDERLSIEARGMLALLMTYSDDWVYRAEHLMEIARVGRDRFRKIMKELIDAGYVSREHPRGEGGKVSGSTWVIRDDPNRPPENPSLGHRPPEKPTAGKHVPLRRPKTKKTKSSSDSEILYDFEPDRDMIEFAMSLGLTESAIREETERWQKVCRESGERPKYPIAAWRAWMRKAPEHRAKALPGRGVTDRAAASVMRKVAREHGLQLGSTGNE